MASIAFNDGVLTTLSPRVNGITAASRFNGWQPSSPDVGPVGVRLGSGGTMTEVLRTDYLATFVVPYLFADDMAVALRLIRYFMRGNGNTVTVNTTDLAARSYTCERGEGCSMEFVLVDPQELRYELRATVRNVAAADMICTYKAGP